MKPLSLFEGYGIEIEVMVVDVDTLDVRPVVDELLRDAGGGEEWIEDHDDGPIGWSNELVSHVVELKTNGPAPSYEGLTADFLASQRRMDARLRERWNARLLPSGMHPWMDPTRETKIWAHHNREIYGAYDRLFDCRRHGWANVQSVHLNLPFSGEDEFGRLMAACRLVLPLIPALAASSPFVEGRRTDLLDNRLEFYRLNSARVPWMTGSVIPEPIFGMDEYREGVLGRLGNDLRALGAEPVLCGPEWANARGTIARFDRMALEIRLIDAQEGPAADLAVAAAVTGVVRALVEERWSTGAAQREWTTQALYELLLPAFRLGPAAPTTAAFARAMGCEDALPTTLGELWRELVPRTFQGPAELEAPLETIQRDGTLAQRLLRALPDAPDRTHLRQVYRRLADDLVAGRGFGV